MITKYQVMKLIMDDSFACSFQTMGQYRSALIKEIDKMNTIIKGNDKVDDMLDKHFSKHPKTKKLYKKCEDK
jgi:hypothetical protein